jgi:hypothetical protein
MPIVFMVFFFPIWLFFGSLFLRTAYQAMFLGDTSLTSLESYLAGMIGLIVFLPLVLLILMSYGLNQLVITDQRIYIRKGVTGRTQIFRLEDVRSFQTVTTSGSNRATQAVLFYLFCGKQVKTGNLYFTLSSLQALLEVLRGKYEGRGFTRRELAQLNTEHPEAGQPVSKWNWGVVLLMLAPFLVALIQTLDFLGVF